MRMNREQEHYAREAERLLSDEVLASAFETVRLRAMVDLTTVDPDNKTQILRLQAKANILSEVVDELKAAIAATGRNDGGFSPSKPTA